MRPLRSHALLLPPRCSSPVGRSRSAELYSVVSPNCIRQGVRKFEAAPAGSSSRQFANLRSSAARPGRNPIGARTFLSAWSGSNRQADKNVRAPTPPTESSRPVRLQNDKDRVRLGATSLATAKSLDREPTGFSQVVGEAPTTAPEAGALPGQGSTESRPTGGRGERDRAGFSLLEIMVAVSLLTFIMIALTVMFAQTKNAVRAGLNQVGVLDSARATMSFLSQTIQEAAPSQQPDIVNLHVGWTGGYTEQELPGDPNPRYNLLQDFFVLSRSNDYLVRQPVRLPAQ